MSMKSTCLYEPFLHTPFGTGPTYRVGEIAFLYDCLAASLTIASSCTPTLFLKMCMNSDLLSLLFSTWMQSNLEPHRNYLHTGFFICFIWPAHHTNPSCALWSWFLVTKTSLNRNIILMELENTILLTCIANKSNISRTDRAYKCNSVLKQGYPVLSAGHRAVSKHSTGLGTHTNGTSLEQATGLEASPSPLLGKL